MYSTSRQIDATGPTDQDLRALIAGCGFPRLSGAPVVLQRDPDPSQPEFVAAAYLVHRSVAGVHVAMFRVEEERLIGWPRTYSLLCRIAHESESPALATCPSSLLERSDDPAVAGSAPAQRWRERCRDFELAAAIAGGDPVKTQTLGALRDQGRLVFSRVG